MKCQTSKIGKLRVCTIIKHCFSVSVENGYVVTEFISNNVVSALLKQWPIWLGIGIVLIICSTIIFALYKTNSFGKFRFYKELVEDAKQETKEIRRQSQMRISARQTSGVMNANFDQSALS